MFFEYIPNTTVFQRSVPESATLCKEQQNESMLVLKQGRANYSSVCPPAREVFQSL